MGYDREGPIGRARVSRSIAALLLAVSNLGCLGCSRTEDLATLSTSSLIPRAISFSRDGHLLITASAGPPAVNVWKQPDGTLLHRLTPSGSDVSAIALSLDGRLLATAWDEIELWDLSAGRRLKGIPGFGSTMDCIAFSPDGKSLACVNRNGSLKLIEVASGKDLFSLKGHDEWISWIAFSPDGKLLATASKDLTVKLWESETGRSLASISTKGDPFSWVGFGPDGTLVMFKSMYGIAQVWDIGKHEALREYKVFSGYPQISADGRTLAVVSAHSDEASVRDVLRGNEIAGLSWNSKTGGTKVVGLNADGTLVGVGVPDGTIRIWKIRR